MASIPATIDEAVDRCTALDSVARATGWERAAIVWAFTVKARPGPRSGDLIKSDEISIIDFAALGIPGLKSQNTVRRYHDAWQAAIDDGRAKPVKPGDDIELPVDDWPPVERSLREIEQARPDVAEAIEREAKASGITRNVVAHVSTQPGAVAAAIKADPRIAAAARAALAASDDERDQRNLEVIARGGRVRPLDEINCGVGDRPLDGMIERADMLHRGLRTVEQGRAILSGLGQLDDDERAKVQAAAMSLADLIATGNATIHRIGA